ncbi:MAG: BMP family ABC transporter substrate-binding protein [Lachnospiraceae bacterium]|nr:BMP family ABC transporter substrate-binding protein [Lachnospiraceae bacterium]
MKKLLSFILAAAVVFSMTACSGEKKSAEDGGNIKIGVILVGDDTEGYTAAHIEGIKKAAQALNVADDQIIWKYKVEENSNCYEAAVDLAGAGCDVIFSNSYGHQTFMAQAAEEYPDVTFVSMTGDFAAVSGLDNFKNAFTKVFESRYVSGVVAGLKLKELLEEGILTEDVQPDSFDADGNVKIGYVGAYSYAEVVSGYTAFYLGVKSIVDNVVMEVKYTNSWFDIDKEAAAAEALVANGCVIISQHADSTGAPAAIQKLLDNGTICYSVGYNIDMLETAPTAALTSATNTWSVYYTYAIGTVLKGEDIMPDWAEGYEQDAVAITKLGESCAEGTAEKVAEVEEQLKNGSLKVFDTATFTVDGKKVTSAPVDLSYYDYSSGAPVVVYAGDTEEAISGGAFEESTLRSAPYFALRIDGITEDAEPVE